MKSMKQMMVLALVCMVTKSFAATGQFFNVDVTATTISTTTNTPNHYYPAAGVQITTPGFTLADAGVDCNLLGNGYCLFGVSDTQAKVISFEGVGETVRFDLCLNGRAPWTCERHDIGITLFVTLENGYIAESVDNGVSWTLETPPDGTAVNAMAFLEINAVGSPLKADFLPKQSRLLFQQFAATQSGNVFASSTAGASWSARTQPDGTPVYDIQSPPIAFPQENELLVGTGGGIVATSADRGVSWTAFPAQPDGSAVYGVSFDCNCTSCYYAGTANGNVAYTSDSGVSWTLLTQPEAGVAVFDVQTSNSCDTLYVGLADGQTKASFNGGVTWQIEGIPNGTSVNGLLVHHNQSGYAATNNGQIFYTQDFGQIWSALPTLPFSVSLSEKRGNKLKATTVASIDVITLPAARAAVPVI